MKQERQERPGLLVLLGCLLILCSTLLSVSMNLHTVMIRTIEESGMGQELAGKKIQSMIAEMNLGNYGIAFDAENFVQNSQGVEEISGKLAEEMLTCVEEGKSYQEVDVSEEVDLMLSEMVDSVLNWNSGLGSLIKDMVTSLVQTQNEEVCNKINAYAAELLEQMQQEDGKISLALDAYALLYTGWFRCCLVILLVAAVILTVLLTESLGNACLWLGAECGCTALLLLVVIKSAANSLLGGMAEQMYGVTISLYAQPFADTGKIFLIAAAVLLVIGLVMKGLGGKKKKDPYAGL